MARISGGLLFFLCIFMSLATHASQELSMRVIGTSGKVYVMIVNNSDRELKINRRFAVGYISRGADVSFVFRPVSGGDEKVMTANAESSPLRGGDIINIRPREVIGNSYDTCFLAMTHSLDIGRYYVEVEYSSKIEWEPFSKEADVRLDDDVVVDIDRTECNY